MRLPSRPHQVVVMELDICNIGITALVLGGHEDLMLLPKIIENVRKKFVVPVLPLPI